MSCLPQDEFNATPLITACGNNKIDVAQFLIEKKANINYQNTVCLFQLILLPNSILFPQS